MKVRVPQCPRCDTLLAPIKYKVDAYVLAVLVCLAIVLATIGQFVDESYSFYLIAMFVTVAGALAAWFYISGQSRKPKWRIFLDPGDSSADELDPHILGLRNYEAQMFSKPKRRDRFNRSEFFKNFLLYSVGISVVTVIFLFPEVESVAICLYAVVAVIIAVFSAEIVNGHFKMGQYWSGGIQIGFLGLFAIIAFYLYPVLF